jgi:hypothetical protein
LPTTSSPSSIPAGAEVAGAEVAGAEVAGAEAIQINKPGTAAQTKIVRIISQTAVIFSTINSIDF